jgi:hypothetical protein
MSAAKDPRQQQLFDAFVAAVKDARQQRQSAAT